MINSKKIVNFSMPKRKPKKKNNQPINDNLNNKNSIEQSTTKRNNYYDCNPAQSPNFNQEEADFWVDCKK